MSHLCSYSHDSWTLSSLWMETQVFWSFFDLKRSKNYLIAGNVNTQHSEPDMEVRLLLSRPQAGRCWKGGSWISDALLGPSRLVPSSLLGVIILVGLAGPQPFWPQGLCTCCSSTGSPETLLVLQAISSGGPSIMPTTPPPSDPYSIRLGAYLKW